MDILYYNMYLPIPTVIKILMNYKYNREIQFLHFIGKNILQIYIHFSFHFKIKFVNCIQKKIKIIIIT